MVIRILDGAGKQHVFGQFEEGHCLRLTDLLPDGQAYELLRLVTGAPAGGICRLHRCRSLGRLYRQLILNFLSVVLDELLLNFGVYQLPQAGATWRVLPKSREEVRHIARIDTYKFVDFKKSQGRIYELVMNYRAFGRRHRRLLRVDYARYQRLCFLVENPPPGGRKPRSVRTRELALRLRELYPYLEPESIVATCTEFMQLLLRLVRRNLELRLSQPTKRGLSLKIYKVNFNFAKVNYRAARGSSRRRRERWVRRRRVFFQRELGIPKLDNLFELNPR